MNQIKTSFRGSIVFALSISLTLLFSFATQAQVSSEERQALIDFYNATNGDSWKNTIEGDQPWLINDPNSLVTDWYGIEVANGKVTKINMFKNNLTGTLPNSIGNLVSVTQLVLSSNNIGGELPSSLQQMTALGSLHLSNNEFIGLLPFFQLRNSPKITHLYFDRNNFSGPIPPEIGQFSNLLFVNLGSNNLTGAIPVELGQLKKISSLYLSRNQLSGTIPPQIGEMTKLRNLSLSDNNLSGTIPPELGNLPNIGSLSFAGNQFTGSIPPELGQLTELFSLSFNGNQLTGAIPTELGNLTKVVRFYMADNKLTGNIPSEFGNLLALENLQLGDNDLSGVIPSSLGALPKLKNISMRNNQLTGSIPVELGELKTLEHAHLHNNNFTGVIPDSFSKLTNLKSLYLYNNSLSGKIPTSISTLPNITAFGISGNKFVFSDFESDFTAFDTNISSFTHTQMKKAENQETLDVATGASITLTSPSFTSTNNSYQWYKNNAVIPGATSNEYIIANVAETDAGVYKLLVTNSVIKKLNIYRNDITLSVSEATDTCGVSEIEKQALIDLYNATDGANWKNKANWLTDTPVCDWFGVTVRNGRVIKLNFVSNDLNGELPESLSQLTEITRLDFANNNLSGVIPGMIFSSLNNLSHLFLSGNNLTGTIPLELGQLIKAVVVNLGANQLTGAIPVELGQLTNLESLLLYDNKLTGTIPTELGQLINLKELRLRKNQLSGKIPVSISQLTDLKNFFSIEENKFVFADFESEFNKYTTNLGANFTYSPQSKIGLEETITITQGAMQTVLIPPHTPSRNDQLQWYKDGVAIPDAPGKLPIGGNPEDAGIYYYTVTNSIVTGLTLERNPITVTIIPAVDTCGVSESEKQALIDLYNATNGANWTNNTNWLTDTPVCDWFGVTEINGKLIINLASNNLSGDVPQEISQLTNLTELYLDNNELTGNIPSQLNILSKLVILSLSNNELDGSISSDLSNLTSLELLKLNDNNFSGRIPSGIAAMANLDNFGIAGNNFVFSDFETEFQVYSNNLTSFDYLRQRKVDNVETSSIETGKTITFSSTVLTSVNNSYQWYKDGVAITGATTKDYVIENASDADVGIYHFTASNSVVTDLTLERNAITLTVTPITNQLAVTINTKDLPNSQFDVVSGTTTIPDLISGNPDSERLVELGADTGDDKIVLIKVKPSQVATGIDLRFTANSTGVSNVEVLNNNTWLDFSPEFYRIDGSTIYFKNRKNIRSTPFTLNLVNGVQYNTSAGQLILKVKDGIDLTGATLEIIFPENSGGEGESEGEGKGKGKEGSFLNIGLEGSPLLGSRSSQIIQPSQTINGFEVDGGSWSSGSYKFKLNIQGKIFKGGFVVVQSGGGSAEF